MHKRNRWQGNRCEFMSAFFNVGIWTQPNNPWSPLTEDFNAPKVREVTAVLEAVPLSAQSMETDTGIMLFMHQLPRCQQKNRMLFWKATDVTALLIAAFRNWMNSLGVQPFVNNLYSDLCDGLILLEVGDSCAGFFSALLCQLVQRQNALFLSKTFWFEFQLLALCLLSLLGRCCALPPGMFAE